MTDTLSKTNARSSLELDRKWKPATLNSRFDKKKKKKIYS